MLGQDAKSLQSKSIWSNPHHAKLHVQNYRQKHMLFPIIVLEFLSQLSFYFP